ncbi:hypothetical protein [Haladaptatus salinisoli]|uniref:hypothetical protein n=1 Tax=Haladaptatus salinisoli TaxID=2884876 RepID=UPI001D09B72A|nr:hypothetical protein [Haladaptatus salinisoli]
MPDYSFHRPEYSGTTTGEWSSPRENDFDTDDLSTIADHFLLSSSGFPPDDFTDLKLPVVNPDGELNLNALETAHGGAHSVEAIDGIDDDTKRTVKDTVEELASDEFDHEIGD